MKEKNPCCTISVDNGATMGRAWTWRYRSISSDLQRPKSRILSGSTSAHSNAMAPLERRERMEMSCGVIPTVVPRVVQAVRRRCVKVVVLIDAVELLL
jgi:hypothetical protein